MNYLTTAEFAKKWNISQRRVSLYCKEITAFMDGEKLDEIAKAREEGKRPYQHILLAVGAGVITLVIACLFVMIFK